MELEVLPAEASRWPDVVSVFRSRRCGPDFCWCQRFRQHDEPHNQDALRLEMEGAVAPVGVLAYLGGDPAGWCRVVPRSTLPGITGNRSLRRLLEPGADGWWVTCCVVRPEHRGRGVGVALLAGAVGHARSSGAPFLDGHPVDVARLKNRPSPSALFTGTLSSFLRAGFEEVGRTYPSRPLMRHHLSRQAVSH